MVMASRRIAKNGLSMKRVDQYEICGGAISDVCR